MDLRTVSNTTTAHWMPSVLINHLLKIIKMNNNKILHGFIFAAGGLVTIIIFFAVYALIKPNQQYIDLPEEISQGVRGDALYIHQNTKDTLSLGFRPL